MSEKFTKMVELLTELAIIVSEADHAVDWGELNIREDDAYRMMATHVLDLMEKHHPSDQLVTLMAVATHLMVENFVLHMHLEMLRFNMGLH